MVKKTQNNNYITDIAIIGAGPVGLFCIFQAGMLGMSTIVIDTLEQIGGQCSALYPEKPIYDIPGFTNISAQHLIDNLAKQSSPFHPKYLLNQMVESLIKEGDLWKIKTSQNIEIKCKAVIIAAGCGAFVPNRPPLQNIENYENSSVFYSVVDRMLFKNKQVVIAGGGDSALDWALSLSEIAKKIYVVHRRDSFRALDKTIKQTKKIAEESGRIEFIIPYQLNKINGDNSLIESIEVVDLNNNIKVIKADYLLPFFGLKMDLGPINDWKLNIDKNHIVVDPKDMMTNAPGIYAIGDITNYPGKLKLILTGFAEAANACHNAYSCVFPNKALHFEYSTKKGITEKM